jgi:hypothetical protein
MLFLVFVALVGIVLMIVVFPRPENLASMVSAQMAKPDESSMGTIEEWEQYKNAQEAQDAQKET